nr:hypothetical protein CFP56_32644 [Quercus suber]
MRTLLDTHLDNDNGGEKTRRLEDFARHQMDVAKERIKAAAARQREEKKAKGTSEPADAQGLCRRGHPSTHKADGHGSLRSARDGRTGVVGLVRPFSGFGSCEGAAGSVRGQGGGRHSR